ncbi:ABC-type transport system substrate-binding protein, partial [Yonghaparkia alkaliphila]|nr:ABC-type transport system substrate-binding protein [Microcella alkalica]
SLSATLDEAVRLTGDEQKAAWGEAFDILAEQAVLYPLFHRQLPAAWDAERLVGFAPVPTTGLSFLDVGVTD